MLIIQIFWGVILCRLVDRYHDFVEACFSKNTSLPTWTVLTWRWRHFDLRNVGNYQSTWYHIQKYLNLLKLSGVLLFLLTATMFPQSGNKISNGLFTPPAEPFLPPVDPLTPPVSRTQRSNVPQQQDELEFRSLDENDEPWKDDAPACAVSRSNYTSCCEVLQQA